jgi:hypothetical protein
MGHQPNNECDIDVILAAVGAGKNYRCVRCCGAEDLPAVIPGEGVTCEAGNSYNTGTTCEVRPEHMVAVRKDYTVHGMQVVSAHFPKVAERVVLDLDLLTILR